MTNDKIDGKRHSRLAAFTLNFVLMPAGYVYVGRTKLAIFVIASLMCLIILGFFASVAFPPGLFVLVGEKSVNPLAILFIAVCAGVHAAWLASIPKASNLSGPLFWLALFGLPLSFLGLAVLWRAFGPFPTYFVASESGLPALAKGDVVVVIGARATCGTSKPHLGNLIVYKKGSTIYLKRAIAGAGETVTLKQGKLILNGTSVATHVVGSTSIDPSLPGAPNGQIITETLPNGAVYQTLFTGQVQYLDNFGPYTVPQNNWFVMGDNRDNSLDSRTDGPVDQSLVCGTVLKIINSPISSHIGQELGSRAHP